MQRGLVLSSQLAADLPVGSLLVVLDRQEEVAPLLHRSDSKTEHGSVRHVVDDKTRKN